MTEDQRRLALIVKVDTLCTGASLWRGGVRCYVGGLLGFYWRYLTFEQAEQVTCVDDIYRVGTPLHGYEDEDDDTDFFVKYPEAECWYEEWDYGDDDRTLHTRSYITPRYRYPFE